MASLKHNCEVCSSEFTIRYDEMKNESDPTYCPFCGEYLLESENIDDEDDE
jgi:predicted  nucleic acid-binding Zn-ribbon protein